MDQKRAILCSVNITYRLVLKDKNRNHKNTRSNILCHLNIFGLEVLQLKPNYKKHFESNKSIAC